ncbi:peroxynitrite isomerase THAP4-like [Sycon ciliatum]|uniref:peroxynitrite isomerase THAP4-like n=1 Tax=Sycon ciliatum TaxID=27933 RepID=UPI0031F6296D
MVKKCCAYRCKSKYKVGGKVSFHSFPRESSDSARRDRWIKALHWQNWRPKKLTWVCSQHFVGGAKSDDPLSPAFVPRIFRYTTAARRLRYETQLKSYIEQLMAGGVHSAPQLSPISSPESVDTDKVAVSAGAAKDTADHIATGIPTQGEPYVNDSQNAVVLSSTDAARYAAICAEKCAADAPVADTPTQDVLYIPDPQNIVVLSTTDAAKYAAKYTADIAMADNPTRVEPYVPYPQNISVLSSTDAAKYIADNPTWVEPYVPDSQHIVLSSADAAKFAADTAVADVHAQAEPYVPDSENVVVQCAMSTDVAKHTADTLEPGMPTLGKAYVPDSQNVVLQCALSADDAKDNADRAAQVDIPSQGEPSVPDSQNAVVQYIPYIVLSCEILDNQPE